MDALFHISIYVCLSFVIDMHIQMNFILIFKILNSHSRRQTQDSHILNLVFIILRNQVFIESYYEVFKWSVLLVQAYHLVLHMYNEYVKIV